MTDRNMPPRHAAAAAERQAAADADADRIQVTTEQERAEGTPADSAHYQTEPVEIAYGKDLKQLTMIRAIMAGAVAGLGALAAGVTGSDTITLAVGLTAAASAAAAAGAVYGIQPESKPLDTRMTTADLAAMRQRRDGPPRGRRSAKGN